MGVSIDLGEVDLLQAQREDLVVAEVEELGRVLGGEASLVPDQGRVALNLGREIYLPLTLLRRALLRTWSGGVLSKTQGPAEGGGQCSCDEKASNANLIHTETSEGDPE